MKPRSIYKTQALAKCSDPRYLFMPIMGTPWVKPVCHAESEAPNERQQRETAPCEEWIRKERARIAADIHDTLAQSLAGILLQLEAAEYDFFENPKAARRKTRRALNLVSEAIVETRRYMWTLFHEPITGEDPAQELSTFAHKVFAGSPVKVELSLAKGPCPLPSHTCSQLLRIGKEALCNASKHAQPSRVCVELEYLQQQVRLEVHDDGKGFRADASTTGRQGFGLCGMRARATEVGGSVTVNSKPGLGTRILALMPIPSAEVQTTV
jgi:signal transduction histidine kinase